MVQGSTPRKCDENCLHCLLDECIHDTEERIKAWKRDKSPQTNAGVHYSSVGNNSVQYLPTKRGYEYFVFKPL